MLTCLRSLFAVFAVASFATTSLAEFDWRATYTGNHYARVADGECTSGVTVFWKNDGYGKGWRVAFDAGKFHNLNLATAGDAKMRAEELFYATYFGTRNYNPSCPPGVLPASQQPLGGGCGY